ncbi:Cupredoxin [Trichophaea hybrida]|nr:Cupredoxin [Trichophaea hybrida]
MAPPHLHLILLLVSIAHCALVQYNFNITWVIANPDGQFPRRTIGINGQWPLPTINVFVGDRLVVNVHNDLGNQSTTIHFHGILQNGTSYMDGVPGVTQCAIMPGMNFTYDFVVDQPGTYWYHSHVKGQYPDGLRGPLIVHDPDGPYAHEYDQQFVLTLSDWYHEQMSVLSSQFLSPGNPDGIVPVPQAALMNDSRDVKIPVQRDKVYRFRIINIAAAAGFYVWIEGHSLEIIEVDGVYTERAETEGIYITSGQRYSVLVRTRSNGTANFAIVGAIDQMLYSAMGHRVGMPSSTMATESMSMMRKRNPATGAMPTPSATETPSVSGVNLNVTGWLVYDESQSLPQPTPLSAFKTFDDTTLSPLDKSPLLPADHTITLNVTMAMHSGVTYSFFNGISYVPPQVPTLYTALTTGSNATLPGTYGNTTNTFILSYNSNIQLVINNLDTDSHPFHKHGSHMQVVARSPGESGPYNGTISSATPHPIRRDTILVEANSHVVLRFPAMLMRLRVWLLHCHNEWHVLSGLVATFVEAPDEMQKKFVVPSVQLEVCEAQGTPVTGSAVGGVKSSDSTVEKPSVLNRPVRRPSPAVRPRFLQDGRDGAKAVRLRPSSRRTECRPSSTVIGRLQYI